MALEFSDKKYIKVVNKDGVIYNCVCVNVVEENVTYKVWGLGNPNSVVYVVDSDEAYSEDVTSGNSVLSPTSFTPIKEGYTFVGWRTDRVASSDVITSLNMGSDPITLYAVFKRTLTLSYDGNGSTSGSVASQSATQYYNSGNTANPTFVLPSNGFTKPGFTFAGWELGGVTYTAGDTVIATTNVTLHAAWLTEAFYWFNINDDYTYTYTDGYPTNWTIDGQCCDDINITSTSMPSLDVNCNDHTAYVIATASGATKGCKYVTIYITDINSSISYIMVNGTKITTAGSHTVDVSNLDTLTLSAYNGDNITINYIYFHN